MIRTMYDNYNLWETYTDEDLTELARENNMIEENEEASDDLLWQLRYEEDSFEWDMIKDELDRLFKNKTVIFFGTCGRWNGTFEGGKIGGFWDLFYTAMRDCDYIKITDDDGRFILQGSHHDGTNTYQVKILTDAGIDYFDRWQYGTDSRTERDTHRQIIKRYSHKPNYYKTFWNI